MTLRIILQIPSAKTRYLFAHVKCHEITTFGQFAFLVLRLTRNIDLSGFPLQYNSKKLKILGMVKFKFSLFRCLYSAS